MTSTKFETKPLFTRQQLTALLLPLIAEQALSVTIGLADTLMVCLLYTSDAADEL